MFLKAIFSTFQRALDALGFSGRAMLKNRADFLRFLAATATLAALQIAFLAVADSTTTAVPVGGPDWLTMALVIASVMVAFALIWVPLLMVAHFIFSQTIAPATGALAPAHAPSASWVSALARATTKPPRAFS